MNRWMWRVAGAWALWLAAVPALAAGEDKLAGRRMQMTETITAADFQQVEGGPLLLAAYAVVWVIFFGAAVWIYWRLRRVNAEMRRLEGRLGAEDPNSER